MMVRLSAEDILTTTPRYAAILGAATEIARGMGHRYVGVEHLFLANIRDPRAVPTQILADAVALGDIAAKLRSTMESAAYNTPTRKIVGLPGDE